VCTVNKRLFQMEVLSSYTGADDAAKLAAWKEQVCAKPLELNMHTILRPDAATAQPYYDCSSSISSGSTGAPS
jgi:hypothetical protein